MVNARDVESIRVTDSDPLLPEFDPLPGVVDYHGDPIIRSASGRWRSAIFIIGVEITERFAYYGVSSNLITYLTGPLQQSTASAAASVNAWTGACLVLPLFGAFIADSWLGRYRTIVFASLLYLLALVMLTISSILPSTQSPKITLNSDSSVSVSTFQLIFFYFSLYLVSVAESGHKPCIQAFGADQFDQKDPHELVQRSSFFNWWYFGISGGSIITVSILNYIQDNVGWSFGFGIPCVVMCCALLIFLIGTKTYRFYPLQQENNFAQIGKYILEMINPNSKKKHRKEVLLEETCSSSSFDEENNKKRLLKLFPIWFTCLAFAIVFAQYSTFFTKQTSTLDRRIGSTFKVPPAALQSFINISIVVLLPIYDKVLVPILRKITKLPSGLTMLQRIGIGMVISLLTMTIAALVEMKRLNTAKKYGLVDEPSVPIPMSLWWIIPQYLLAGMAEMFTIVGLQEFFYDQVPDEFRSLGLALYTSIFGLGSLISSFLVSLIDKITTMDNRDSWFADNLNRAHIDYFYWLLVGLSASELIAYFYFARTYVYKRKVN